MNFKMNTYLNSSLIKYILEHLTQKHKFRKNYKSLEIYEIMKNKKVLKIYKVIKNNEVINVYGFVKI